MENGLRNESALSDWVVIWQTSVGETTFRMSFEADGSADFNGVGGTWTYGDGKLVIGGVGGTSHEFPASVDETALTLIVEGMPHPLVLERVAPDAGDGVTSGQDSVTGLLGEWVDAQGGEISFRPDGVLLNAGIAMRYLAGGSWISFIQEGQELRVPFALSGDRLILGTDEAKQVLHRKGAQADTNTSLADEVADLQTEGYTEKDAKDIEEMLSRLSQEERHNGLIVGLVTHGYMAVRSLFLLAQKRPNSAVLQQQCLDATTLSLSWLSGQRITDRADEDERRVLVALDILKIGGEDSGLHRLAARAILNLPAGHPLRDEEAARDALVKQLGFCIERQFWGGWIATLTTLLEYDLVDEEAANALTLIAENVLGRDPQEIFGEQIRFGDEKVALAAMESIASVRPDPKEMLIELRRDFRVALLKYMGGQAIRARDAGDKEGFRENIEKAEEQVSLIAGDQSGDTTAPTGAWDLMGLIKELANKPTEAADFYARALVSPNLGLTTARRTAQREASLRVRAGEFPRAIKLLEPILATLETAYLASVEDGEIEQTGKDFATVAGDLAFSYASSDRWSDAMMALDRAKSLRLRHRAALRESEAGEAIVGVERALYASSRGATGGSLNTASDKDPVGKKLSAPTRTLELYRQARLGTRSDWLSSPTIAEIAQTLGADEACVIFGIHSCGTLLAVIFPNDEVTPGAHRILSDQTWTALFHCMSDGENGWLRLNALPILANNKHRESIGELIPRLDQSLGLPLAELLAGRGVRRLTIIPHHFLHLAPFWALPSLEGLQMTMVPSAAHLLKSRVPRPTAMRAALAVIDPTLDLPMSPAEADAMQQHLAPYGWTSRCLSRADAQEENVVEALRASTILHFSGHGRSDGLHPMKSCLLLHPNLDRFAALGSDPLEALSSCVEQWEHDPWQGIHVSFPGLGRLYQIAYEEAELKERTLEYSDTGTLWHRYRGTVLTHRAEQWRAGDIMVQGAFRDCRLAFLSSCHSGSAWNLRSREIDEFAGLPAALLLAGVGSVVASLWPVDDVTTALFTDKFYAALAESDGVADVAALVHQTAAYLRTLTKDQAERRLTELRKFTADPTARFHLQAAAHHLAEGDDMPFSSPYNWGAFYVTGASEFQSGGE